MLSARVGKRTIATAVAVVVALLSWQFSQIVREVDVPATARVSQIRLEAIRFGAPVERVHDLLGAPNLTSDVYSARGYLVQCWYYDLRSREHVEVCFDHWRVFHKERYP